MRKIPDDNLAYPVLIEMDNSIGSGFFLNDENKIYLVSASHVLFNRDTGALISNIAKITSYPKEKADKEKNVFKLDLAKLLSKGHLKYDFSKDVVVLKIGDVDSETRLFNTLSEVEVMEISTTGVVGVGIDNTRTYQESLIANDVFVFGYPVSLNLLQIPQIDYSRPLLRHGIIAGKNDLTKTLVLDLPVYHGNSGGPVIEAEQEGLGFRYRVVGLITEFVPALARAKDRVEVNSGYSIAASLDRVLELVEEV